MIRFDLDALRARFQPKFAEYDEAVRRRDTATAHRCKMDITDRAIEALAAEVPDDARGIYIFKSEADGPQAYIYIGIACSKSFHSRMEGRFRDENCFDEWSSNVGRAQVWDRVYQRICVSMGPRKGHPKGSSPEKKLDYAYQHAKTVTLFRNASAILFFPMDAPDEAIKSAESLLIYAGTSRGAPLLNIQERDKLSARLGPGEELARHVMRQLPDGEQWTSTANDILERFGGSCC